MPTGMRWSVAEDGGYLANQQLSSELRFYAVPMMKVRQFASPARGIGLKKGDTLQYDKIKPVVTKGRQISEIETMPETKMQILQDTMTVAEWGNSIPYTGKLEAVAVFDPSNIIHKGLRDDMAGVLDAAVAAQMQATEIIMTPTGTTAAPTRTTVYTGTCTTVISRNPMVVDLKAGRRILQKMNVKPFDGQDYICLCSVEAYGGIEDDPAFTDAAKYGDPSRLFSGEVGRIAGVRIVLETNALSNALGASGLLGEALLFGADPVMEGVVIPEEIRAKIATDYGRDKGVAWYALGNFKKTWNYTNDTFQPIIRLYGNAA